MHRFQKIACNHRHYKTRTVTLLVVKHVKVNNELFQWIAQISIYSMNMNQMFMAFWTTHLPLISPSFLVFNNRFYVTYELKVPDFYYYCVWFEDFVKVALSPSFLSVKSYKWSYKSQFLIQMFFIIKHLLLLNAKYLHGHNYIRSMSYYIFIWHVLTIDDCL